MKKIIVILCVLVVAALLIPIPSQINDGGSVRYKAILYEVYDVHKLQKADDTNKIEYVEGIIIKLCGIEIFNNTEPVCDHEHNKGDEAGDELDPHFTGKVLETNEKGFLVEVTDVGNGSFAIGEKVQVNTDISSCPEYTVGDHLRIAFDGKVALSYPPQVTSVISIRKTDSQGNNIE